jgi:hypothetical protein
LSIGRLTILGNTGRTWEQRIIMNITITNISTTRMLLYNCIVQLPYDAHQAANQGEPSLLSLQGLGSTTFLAAL